MSWLPWADIHLKALGIEQEAATFIEAHGVEGLSEHMPEVWLDAFAAAGTPEQVSDALQRLIGQIAQLERRMADLEARFK